MMPYEIGACTFKTKDLITTRCRSILANTPDGTAVQEDSVDFLFGVFQYHDEWQEKSSAGVVEITTTTTPHGTRCFVLRGHSGTEVDISFPYAVGLIPTARSGSKIPQPLIDFRAAARQAIQAQIWSFRDLALISVKRCSITGEALVRSNAAVDHEPPDTFDQLLFAFCQHHGINPLHEKVGSLGGTIAVFEDKELERLWDTFHASNARLRVVSKTGNLRLAKAVVPWREFCGW